jgi:hypothetical protein
MGAGLGVRSILPTAWVGPLFREAQSILRPYTVIPSRHIAFFLNEISQAQVQSRLPERLL